MYCFYRKITKKYCFRYHSSYLSDGSWSPVRPGVFFTTNMDGIFDVWDYLIKQNNPTLSVQVYAL